MKKILLYGSISGIIASLVIGFYFKWIERNFHIKVYTLLLNIDYFPILKHIHFSEMIEFLFHIIVSIIIATILLFITHYFKWSRQQIGLRTILISMFIGDRKSTRLNSSHVAISYAVFCLKKKKKYCLLII